MNEHNFDEILKIAAPELPPDEIVRKVTPWSKSMNRILVGMALSTVTLNFLALNFIIPTIGMILLLLGFRTLKRENKWFKSCLMLTILRACSYFPLIILNATIYQNSVYNSPLGTAINIVNSLLQILLVICFYSAIKTVQKKAGIPAKTKSAVALLIWYTAVIFLAFAEFNGLVIGAIAIVCYILIIRSLYNISKETEKSGYAVKASEVYISDRSLAKILVIVLIIGIISSNYLFGSYNMDWKAEEGERNKEIIEIKDELLSLGYPKLALEDLSDDDIYDCKGALQVVFREDDKPINNGREVRNAEGNTTIIKIVYDVKELHLTHVAVEISGEKPQWRIFHHFLWTVNNGFIGTELLQLWPAYRNSDGWEAAGELKGRVLYDENGIIYTAPFNSLAVESYTSDSIFWGKQDLADIFATFSMPKKGERQRGYVSYSIKEIQEGFMVNAWVNYTHQTSRLQYPVLTAAEKRKLSDWNNSYPFITVQSALQFFRAEDGIELLSESNS
ncbi:MAG TPA: hypothetical protein VFD25_02395 [Clostridia bacterium]|nr:hypothetical protein [Clostridia bacterium]